MEIKEFIKKNFKHFNAAALVDAAEAYKKHLDKGGKVLITLAGAMSTAELGISLAEMIRQDKVHAICCTGANLEEDLFNLIAHQDYLRVPNYRELTPEDEKKLNYGGWNRVTDTCIPEEMAIRVIDKRFIKVLQDLEISNSRLFPHQILYWVIDELVHENVNFHIDPKDSWLMAAKEKNIPIFVPGWEDSSLGTIFVARYMEGKVNSLELIRSGLDYTVELIKWYLETSEKSSMGFFQIGGGIAGDFAIAVVPLIRQDLQIKVPLWNYFCQISDSTTSYGSYSGAVPNEKITWDKLDSNTPRFIIESDATIVCPLIFAYLLA